MIYASVPELRGEDEFELHEGHAFGNDGQREEAVGEELAEVVDSSVIDFVDAQREPVHAAIRDKFALVGMYLLDQVVEFFQKCGVIQIRVDARHGVARKPAALVVRIKNFEIISFDFDDQPQFFRELKLVSIVAGSAVNKIADVDRSGLQPY